MPDSVESEQTLDEAKRVLEEYVRTMTPQMRFKWLEGCMKVIWPDGAPDWAHKDLEEARIKLMGTNERTCEISPQE